MIITLDQIIEENQRLFAKPIDLTLHFRSLSLGYDDEQVMGVIFEYLLTSDPDTQQDARDQLAGYFTEYGGAFEFVVAYHSQNCRRDIFLTAPCAEEMQYIGSVVGNVDRPKLRLVRS